MVNKCLKDFARLRCCCGQDNCVAFDYEPVHGTNLTFVYFIHFIIDQKETPNGTSENVVELEHEFVVELESGGEGALGKREVKMEHKALAEKK